MTLEARARKVGEAVNHCPLCVAAVEAEALVQLREAVWVEREACALVADISRYTPVCNTCEDVDELVASIRARSEEQT